MFKIFKIGSTLLWMTGVGGGISLLCKFVPLTFFQLNIDRCCIYDWYIACSLTYLDFSRIIYSWVLILILASVQLSIVFMHSSCLNHYSFLHSSFNPSFLSAFYLLFIRLSSQISFFYPTIFSFLFILLLSFHPTLLIYIFSFRIETN